MTKSGSYNVSNEYDSGLRSDLFVRYVNFMSCISYSSCTILRSNYSVDVLYNEQKI